MDRINQEMNVRNGYKILTFLAGYFGTTTPLLEFKLRKKARRQGYYKYVREQDIGLICINMGGDWVNTVLHEYAHHLDHEWHGSTHHNLDFAWCLYRVVKCYYGPNMGLYTWDVERKVVKTYFRLSCQIVHLWKQRELLLDSMVVQDITSHELEHVVNTLGGSVLEKRKKEREND